VLHYLHHKPLLEDMNQGYFEGRCPSCEWIGRVGRRRPHCSRCGGAVVPV
jgi:phage FluMu protein Com